MARLFVAAWPDTEVAAALAALDRRNEPGVRWVPAANWHVTLAFLGDLDPRDVAARLEGRPWSRTTAELGPTVGRLDRRQVVIPVGGVDHLAAEARAATRGLGVTDPRPFRGHLTVARTKPGADCSMIGTSFVARFTVEEVALVESELLPEGARYTTLATWPTS